MSVAISVKLKKNNAGLGFIALKWNKNIQENICKILAYKYSSHALCQCSKNTPVINYSQSVFKHIFYSKVSFLTARS